MHAHSYRKQNSSTFRIIGLVLLLSLVLSACGEQATPAPTVDIGAVQTQAAQTVVADLTQNAPPPPTNAPEPTESNPPPGPTPDPDVPNAVVPTPEAGQPAATADFNTFIFSGPGQNYVVYGALLGGRSTLVTGRNQEGTWWAVSVPPAPDGNGWVSAEWVTVTDIGNVPVLPTPPVPATTTLVPPGPADPQVLALVNTFVRSGPGSNYPAYGVAEAGVKGRVIGVSSDGAWWVVRIDPTVVGAGYGWVAAQYVQVSNADDVQVIATPPLAAASSLPAPSPGAATATAVDFVNIRSGPGTNYLVYGVAAPGATAEVSGKSTDGQWWQVVVPTATVSAEGVAWVSTSFVYTQNTENTPVVESPPSPPAVSPENPPTVGNCSLLSQIPEDLTAFSPNQPFVTTWVLQNTGDDAWDQNEYDVRFQGAFNNVILNTGPDVFDLPATINSGWNLPISISMVAPGQPGTYAESWAISLGNQAVCPFFVVIEVK
jgi:uncharacterized protein YraI